MAFGWFVIHWDVHYVAAIEAAVNTAKSVTGRPSIIISETVKGKGVPFMEGKSAWYGKAIGEEDYRLAKAALGGVTE